MKFKKPYSQYLGKTILYDGRHKHFIVRVLGTESEWLYFDTICISYMGGIKTQISDHSGFMLDSEGVELDETNEKEKRLMIIAAINGVRRS